MQATLWRFACPFCYKLNAKLQSFVLFATLQAPNVRRETIAYYHWSSIKAEKAGTRVKITADIYWKKYQF